MPLHGDKNPQSYDLVLFRFFLLRDICYFLSVIVVGMVKTALGVQLVHNNPKVLRIS